MDCVMCGLEASELRIQADELEQSVIPDHWVWDGRNWVSPEEYR